MQKLWESWPFPTDISKEIQAEIFNNAVTAESLQMPGGALRVEPWEWSCSQDSSKVEWWAACHVSLGKPQTSSRTHENSLMAGQPKALGDHSSPQGTQMPDFSSKIKVCPVGFWSCCGPVTSFQFSMFLSGWEVYTTPSLPLYLASS